MIEQIPDLIIPDGVQYPLYLIGGGLVLNLLKGLFPFFDTWQGRRSCEERIQALKKQLEENEAKIAEMQIIINQHEKLMAKLETLLQIKAEGNEDVAKILKIK